MKSAICLFLFRIGSIFHSNVLKNLRINADYWEILSFASGYLSCKTRRHISKFCLVLVVHLEMNQELTRIRYEGSVNQLIDFLRKELSVSVGTCSAHFHKEGQMATKKTPPKPSAAQQKAKAPPPAPKVNPTPAPTRAPTKGKRK